LTTLEESQSHRGVSFQTCVDCLSECDTNLEQPHQACYIRLLGVKSPFFDRQQDKDERKARETHSEKRDFFKLKYQEQPTFEWC